MRFSMRSTREPERFFRAAAMRSRLGCISAAFLLLTARFSSSIMIQTSIVLASKAIRSEAYREDVR